MIKKNYWIFLIPVVAWFVYSGLFVFGHFRYQGDDYNYFKELAISFTQGRLHIPECPPSTNCHDMVNYHGRYYLYEPPLPAFVYIPLVLIQGRNTHDCLINAWAGVLNLFLLIILMRQVSKRFDLKLTDIDIGALAVFWAFGTVHFYMSMLGSVWYVAQVFAQVFLLAALVLLFSENIKRSLLWSGIMFAAAVYTKNNLVFAAFLFAAVYTVIYGIKDRKKVINDGIWFFAPFVLFTVLSMIYNGIRFDRHIFQNGIKYHQMAGHFTENFATHGYLSLFYVPGNFIREVLLPPPFKAQFPFFEYNPEGFGLFWASPVFLLAIPAVIYYLIGLVKKGKAQLGDMRFMIFAGAFVSMGGIALLIYMIMGTGWVQFASRYSLDYQLMLFLFLMLGMRLFNKKWFMGSFYILLLLSIYMNYCGMKYYLG